MAWEQLTIDKPHLAYIIIGGFTSLFMLCSLFVKEKLYIGEATVATICGLIFGPHAANLFSPTTWGNTDKITLECSRIVLVVQCFAVGVELPKAYMERHWKSVTFLLVPVMTAGWLMTSVFVWWLVEPLTWLESLAIAACVTATDPVLASSVVGKGKFAKRVPKHLRDILSAESGCNDGMAFPFIYLSLYLIRYHLEGKEVVFHWVCLTVLYECIFGAVYGFLLGYIGRHLIKYAHRHALIDRESFLVFYFVLALFCAGSGSLLGLDDLLVGFACGVGFSNDGWFTQQTEDSHVSDVIDLLLNLTYFVYFGSVIPWDQFNNPALGIYPWKLVILAILVILFRRIPIMLALKPIIPDVKNWREALFAGHFGPIGVGAIFAAILTRAELETDSTQPLSVLPDDPNSENYLLVQIIWPVVCFLVISSIIVHGSSIAVFTLGKHINTLTLTMSYTQGNEPSWLNRLPRIASMSKSMSKGKGDWDDTSEVDDPEYPAATLSPSMLPGNFLRRQKEEENPSRAGSRASSLRPRHRKKYENGMGPGGPISQSAITPAPRPQAVQSPNSEKSPSLATPDDSEETIDVNDNEKASRSQSREEPDIEAYQEGDHLIVEDEEGNVLHEEETSHESKEEEKQHIDEVRERLKKEVDGKHAKHKHEPHEKDEGSEVEEALTGGLDPEKLGGYRHLRQRFHQWRHRGEPEEEQAGGPKRGPARAYQYGNTIIIEDEDGEVVKRYDLPTADRKRLEGVTPSAGIEEHEVGSSLRRISTWVGLGKQTTGNGDATERNDGNDPRPNTKRRQSTRPEDNHEDDHRIRFTLGSNRRRLNKEDFIKEIQALDPKAQVRAVEDSDAPEGIKSDVKKLAVAKHDRQISKATPPTDDDNAAADKSGPPIQRKSSNTSDHSADLELVDSNSNKPIPFHPISESINQYHASHGGETAAQRRRRIASGRSDVEGSSSRNEPSRNSVSRSPVPQVQTSSRSQKQPASKLDEGETAAERRRRLAALGQGPDQESSSDDDGAERQPRKNVHKPIQEPVKSPGIRFADSPVPTRGRK